MMKLPLLLKVSPALLMLALAGCATDTATYRGPMLPSPGSATSLPMGEPVTTPPGQPSPADRVAIAASQARDVTPYIDPTVAPLLSTVDKTQASNAQYYALQFGRPGAPRNWAGDSGATGTVVVGPFLSVNNLDCREFTHTVKVNKQSYERRGTACRQPDGSWTVTNSGAANG